MEHLENSTASPKRLMQLTQSAAGSQADKSGGSAYLYILIVIGFYTVFLFGIMLGYFRSKRRERMRINIFTRLVHEEERREWGGPPKKPMSHAFPTAVPGLPSCGNHGDHLSGRLHCGSAPQSSLACALCAEQQGGVSSMCSSPETRHAIEEELDNGALEEPEGNAKGGAEDS